MLFLYIISVLPIIAGGVMWFINPKVNIFEWLAGSVVGILTCVAFHAIAINGMTSDVETRSGMVISATRYPFWIERYTVSIYRNVTKTRKVGKKTETYSERVFDHTETRFRDHPETFEAETQLGTFDITDDQWTTFISQMGNPTRTHYRKGGFESGDPDIHVCHNPNNAEIAVCNEYSFENKLIAAPSIFSYAAPPEQCKDLFDYPRVSDKFNSSRLLGTAPNFFSRSQWDKMNGRLGPAKRVNVIAIGYRSGTDSMVSQWQEAKWIGGKKNDLVITFAAGQDGKPEWVRVFGWTEKNEVKHNIEMAIMDVGVKPEAMALIEKSIIADYVIKDWSKFDYISIEPPTWSLLVLVIVMGLTQAAFWGWSANNEIDRTDFDKAIDKAIHR